MAVSITTSLPDQPVTGVNTYTPLGGDGWTAPHSVAEVSMSLAGDGSGGNNTITLNFDPRFVSIVTYVRLANSSGATSIEMTVQMLPALPRSQPQLQAFANLVPVIALTTENVLTWSPPPIPHMARMIAIEPNVNGDSFILMAYIYQFQRTALQQVPLDRILASLPRGDNMVTVMTQGS